MNLLFLIIFAFYLNNASLIMDRDIATKIFEDNKPALILFYKSIS